MTATDCPTDNNSTCFIRIDANLHTIRGCVSNLTADLRSQCNNSIDSTVCNLCIGILGSDGGCNNFVSYIIIIISFVIDS